MSAHKEILNPTQFALVLRRMALVILEHHPQPEGTVLIGLQPRGVFLANRLMIEIEKLSTNDFKYAYGKLDITFYRDDVHKKELLLPTETSINFSIENKQVILIDDVLHTGRTIRAAMDALIDYGRPKKVALLCLINRMYSRELPVQPDYTGLSVDTLYEQRVKVLWKEKDGADGVHLIG